jgi:hypothetical protein
MGLFLDARGSGFHSILVVSISFFLYILAVVLLMQEAETLRDALKSQEKSADVASRLEMVESKFPGILLFLANAQILFDF